MKVIEGKFTAPTHDSIKDHLVSQMEDCGIDALKDYTFACVVCSPEATYCLSTFNDISDLLYFFDRFKFHMMVKEEVDVKR